MSVTNIRVKLHQIIDNIDEPFLKEIHELMLPYLRKDQIIGYDLDGSEVRSNDFVIEAKQAVSAMKKGESGISLSDLEQKSSQWIKNTTS